MQSIYSYTKNVLNALDVKWGPAHIGTYVPQYLRTLVLTHEHADDV